MKKITSLVMAFCLLLSVAVPSYAIGRETSKAVPLNFFSMSNWNDNVIVSADQITYSNVSIQFSEDNDILNCNMSFTLSMGSNKSCINAAGTVDYYTIDDDRAFYHGCLRGTVDIGETEYRVTIGLTKNATSDDFNAGVVLNPNEFSVCHGEGTLVFSIGDYIITNEAESILMGNEVYILKDTNSGESLNGVSSGNSRSMGEALIIRAGIADTIEQSIRVYVQPDQDVIDDYLFEHYPNLLETATRATYSVHEMQVGVRESSSLFSMNGLYTTEVDSNPDYSDFASMVWAIVCDVLSYYNVLTSTLSAVLENMSSEPVILDRANLCSITISGNRVYEDIIESGFGCTFATSPNTSGTSGVGTATAFGNATYRVSVSDIMSAPTIVYVDSDEVTKSVSVAAYMGG